MGLGLGVDATVGYKEFLDVHEMIFFFTGVNLIFLDSIMSPGGIDVTEGQEPMMVCLQLRNVDEPTQAQIWADIVSEDGTAIGDSI